MRGSKIIENPFSKIIKIQDRMFQVNRIFPENQINTHKYENWALILKEYYHVDTIFKANNQLWLCNEIQNISYDKV